MIIKTISAEYNGNVNYIGSNLIEFQFGEAAPSAEEFTEFKIVTGRGKEIPIIGYSTLYRLTDVGFILSNDGSVYVEPEIEEPIEDADPVPTLEERITALEEQNEMLIGCLLELGDIIYAE